MLDIMGPLNGALLDPARYQLDETLLDGGLIHIRAIQPDDRERLLEHFHSLSEESVYYRFFGLKHSLSDHELTQFTQLDFVTHVGLVATAFSDGLEHFIGVARYIRAPGESHAEVAFAVSDAHQGRGIATLLLNNLAKIARSAGVQIFEASVLSGNSRMVEVFEHSGLPVSRTSDGGTVRVTMRLSPEKSDESSG
jgi:RimJ/RimL family protein N-acetyltransferase